MSGAPERKYTDRDVREDEDLMKLAVAYVMNYHGDFDPLVEAQEFLTAEGYLTTSLARKVLNCMRHDANVLSKLPPPKYADNVVSIVSGGRKKKVKEDRDKQCDDPKSHNMHWWDGKYLCNGVPWAINRDRVVLPAIVKVPYAASRTGKLIHDVAPPEMGKKHWTIWSGPVHEYGFRTDEHPWYDSAADLHIKLRCKYPSYISNPILIKADELDKYMEIETVLQGLKQMQMCPHCKAARGE